MALVGREVRPLRVVARASFAVSLPLPPVVRLVQVKPLLVLVAESTNADANVVLVAAADGLTLERGDG